MDRWPMAYLSSSTTWIVFTSYNHKLHSKIINKNLHPKISVTAMPPLHEQRQGDGTFMQGSCVNLFLTDFAGPIQWHRALVVVPTSDPLWVLTSPNMVFIPAPSISQIEVILCEDFHYRVANPTLWPQKFTPGFEYFASILHPNSTMLPHYAPLWSSLRESDFILIEGSVIKCLGLL